MATLKVPRPGIRQSEPGFQSIGVTKEWRQDAGYFVTAACGGFQSIGVTKEWRLSGSRKISHWSSRLFPINRRHQRMATLAKNQVHGRWCNGFPINRRHQRMATGWQFLASELRSLPRFQSIGVTKEWRHPGRPCVAGSVPPLFPINRRHQRMATRATTHQR